MIADGIKRVAEASAKEQGPKRARFIFEKTLYVKVVEVVCPVFQMLWKLNLLSSSWQPFYHHNNGTSDITLQEANKVCQSVLEKLIPQQTPVLESYEAFPAIVEALILEKRQKLLTHLASLKPGETAHKKDVFLSLTPATLEAPPLPFGQSLIALAAYLKANTHILEYRITPELRRFIDETLAWDIQQLLIKDLSLGRFLTSVLTDLYTLDMLLATNFAFSRGARLMLMAILFKELNSPNPLSQGVRIVFENCLLLKMAMEPNESVIKKRLIECYQKELPVDKLEVCEVLIKQLDPSFNPSALLQIVFSDGEVPLSAREQYLLSRFCPVFQNLHENTLLKDKKLALRTLSPTLTCADFKSMVWLGCGAHWEMTLAEWISFYLKLHPLGWDKEQLYKRLTVGMIPQSKEGLAEFLSIQPQLLLQEWEYAAWKKARDSLIIGFFNTVVFGHKADVVNPFFALLTDFEGNLSANDQWMRMESFEIPCYERNDTLPASYTKKVAELKNLRTLKMTNGTKKPFLDQLPNLKELTFNERNSDSPSIKKLGPSTSVETFNSERLELTSEMVRVLLANFPNLKLIFVQNNRNLPFFQPDEFKDVAPQLMIRVSDIPGTGQTKTLYPPPQT